VAAGKSGKASTEHLRRRQGSDWTANWLAINGDHFLIEHTSEGLDGEGYLGIFKASFQ